MGCDNADLGSFCRHRLSPFCSALALLEHCCNSARRPSNIAPHAAWPAYVSRRHAEVASSAQLVSCFSAPSRPRLGTRCACSFHQNMLLPRVVDPLVRPRLILPVVSFNFASDMCHSAQRGHRRGASSVAVHRMPFVVESERDHLLDCLRPPTAPILQSLSTPKLAFGILLYLDNPAASRACSCDQGHARRRQHLPSESTKGGIACGAHCSH